MVAASPRPGGRSRTGRRGCFSDIGDLLEGSEHRSDRRARVAPQRVSARPDLRRAPVRGAAIGSVASRSPDACLQRTGVRAEEEQRHLHGEVGSIWPQRHSVMLVTAAFVVE
jgi:hypothetical protein